MNTTALLRVLCVLAVLVSAGAHAEVTTADSDPRPFSRMPRGDSLAPWTSITIGVGKRPTHYDLVEDSGKVVLHAVADNAASGLACPVKLASGQAPIIAWRWKIAGLIDDADSYTASREDAPARIVLEFDGDKRRLTVAERGIYRLSERLSGRELPYATLMYIWSNRLPVGTVIANPRTRRVQMIVASTGKEGVGTWQSLTRDVHADFRRAFREEPGPLLAVGVMTDTDNTDGRAEAWYGDIRFTPAAR